MAAAGAPTYAIGVDVGATKIAAALVDNGGQVLHAQQTPTAPGRGQAPVLDDIAGWIAAVRQGAPGKVAGDSFRRLPGPHAPIC